MRRWWHPTISSSVIPSSSHLQSFPASGSFPMSRIRWPKCWSISFRISPSNEYSGLIYFTTDGFDLLAVQGTLKSLLQHHSSKASSLQFLAFFMVQFSHPYMTIGKTIALTRQTFVGKAMSLLFNMLSRLVPEWSSGFPHFLQFKSEFGNRSSWSEPQSAPGLVFADCVELLCLWLQRI